MTDILLKDRDQLGIAKTTALFGQFLGRSAPRILLLVLGSSYGASTTSWQLPAVLGSLSV